MDALYFSIAVLFLVALLAVGIRLQKSAKYILMSSGMGVAGLVLINLLSALTKVGLGYTLLTVSASVFLGLPGIVLMLFLKII